MARLLSKCQGISATIQSYLSELCGSSGITVAEVSRLEECEGAEVCGIQQECYCTVQGMESEIHCSKQPAILNNRYVCAICTYVCV